MKSIMHKKEDGTCYLCMMLHSDYRRRSNLQEHHVIFGTGNRRLSERYGLKVYLCLYHHTEGPEAVHKNAALARMLKARAQKAFREHFPELDWMRIFGKSYIEDQEGEEPPAAGGHRQQGTLKGFYFLEKGEEDEKNEEMQ